jgi:hypothetical protein
VNSLSTRSEQRNVALTRPLAANSDRTPQVPAALFSQPGFGQS